MKTFPTYSRQIYTAALVFLVGLCAFGLGRLSVIGGEGEGVRIETYATTVAPASSATAVAVPSAAEAEQPKPPTNTAKGMYVASKSGTVYYLPSCSGANRIKEVNKVWFESKTAAEAAGLRPAANCPGL